MVKNRQGTNEGKKINGRRDMGREKKEKGAALTANFFNPRVTGIRVFT